MTLEQELSKADEVRQKWENQWQSEHGLHAEEWTAIEALAQKCERRDREKLLALRRKNNVPVQDVPWTAEGKGQFSRISEVLKTSGLPFQLARYTVDFKGPYMLHLNCFYLTRTG